MMFPGSNGKEDFPSASSFWNASIVRPIIADDTASATSIFFHNAMTPMSGISCTSLTTIDIFTDPNIPSTPFYDLRAVETDLYSTSQSRPEQAIKTPNLSS